MSKAIKIKQVDPEISLHDALVAGGFVFRKDIRLNNWVDADGITLAQRKNNLCRRIRLEKNKRKAEENNVQAASALASPDTSTRSTFVASGPSTVCGATEGNPKSTAQARTVPVPQPVRSINANRAATLDDKGEVEQSLLRHCLDWAVKPLHKF